MKYKVRPTIVQFYVVLVALCVIGTTIAIKMPILHQAMTENFLYRSTGVETSLRVLHKVLRHHSFEEADALLQRGTTDNFFVSKTNPIDAYVEALRAAGQPIPRRMLMGIGHSFRGNVSAMAITGETMVDPDFEIFRSATGTSKQSNKDYAKAMMTVQLMPQGYYITLVENLQLSPKSFFRWEPEFNMMIIIATVIGLFILISIPILTIPLSRLARAAEQFSERAVFKPVKTFGLHETQTLTDRFNQMGSRLTALFAERMRFAAELGHDLQAPVTSLDAMVRRADAGSIGTLREKLLAQVDEVRSYSNTLLQLSREDADQEPFVLDNVNALVEQVVDAYQGQGAPVTIEDIPGDDVMVELRPIAFRRALRNIIENALKYGQRARVSVEVSDNQVEVRVVDDGPGLDDQNARTAKQPFVQLDDTSRGVGLGLAIVERIAERHGGELRIKCPESRGMSVGLRLPKPS